MSAEVTFNYSELVIDLEEIKHVVSEHYGTTSESKIIKESGVLDQINHLINNRKITLPTNLLDCANLVCSENVFANPLADIKATSKSSIRNFPFIGVYDPLKISVQKQKQFSTQLKGVLGEIIGGIFFESKARTLVRPIQQYPDFIGKLKGEPGYAFLEAKCFEDQSSYGNLKVPFEPFWKIFFNATRDLLIDPSLIIYASFTRIDNADPLELTETIIGISTKQRQKALGYALPPYLLVSTLVAIACSRAIYELSELYNSKEVIKEGDFSPDEIFKKELSERIRRILGDFEEDMGAKPGSISNHPKTGYDIKKEISDEKNQKAIKKVIKGEPLESLEYKELEQGEMDLYFSNDTGYFYQQRFDSINLKIIDARLGTDWEISYLDHNGDNFFFFGETCMTELSSEKDVQSINIINPSKWNKLP